MSNTIIKLENISNQYRLGQVGTWWLSWVEAQILRGIAGEGLRRLQRWRHTMRSKEDPTLKIGQTNHLPDFMEN